MTERSRRFWRMNSICGLLWVVEDEIFPERHLADPEALERYQRHLRELAELQSREAKLQTRVKRIWSHRQLKTYKGG